jgi:hypothetical protein
MPRDPRLYMTFPIDFDEHPKVEPLSDAAFRTFVSMNGYSRRHRLDGRIPADVVKKRWRSKAVSELLGSHPERPLLLLENDGYVIRDYAEHQFTTADEKKLHDDKARAGAKGGRAKAAAIAGAKQLPKQDVAGSGLEIEIDKTIDETHDPEIPTDPAARDGIDPKLAAIIDEEEFVAAEATRLGIRNIAMVRGMLEAVVGPIRLHDSYILDAVRRIIELASEPVQNADGYVKAACINSPDEIRAQWSAVLAHAPKGLVA